MLIHVPFFTAAIKKKSGYKTVVVPTLLKKKSEFSLYFHFLELTSVITCLGVKSIDFRVSLISLHFHSPVGVTSVILKIHLFF